MNAMKLIFMLIAVLASGVTKSDEVSDDKIKSMVVEEAVKRANEVRQGIKRDVDGLAACFEGRVKSGQTEIVSAMLPMAG